LNSDSSALAARPIDTIIFDLGGVLIEWDPRHLYRKIFKTEEEVTWFLDNVCTSEWNDHQDAGRSFQEATDELLMKFPEHEDPIRAWYDRWQETIRGPVTETVNVLKALKDSKKYKLCALTNWSAETFPWALENFEFLHWFQGIVVSGVEKTRKPYPDFYQILLDRYNINPATALFIDDNIKNVDGAIRAGISTIHFQSPQQLREELVNRKIL
jgi:2-haloacid dehalogenase